MTMNRKKLHALYNLKWNPFAQELPIEALWASKEIEHFIWRMEQQVHEGGFALISGKPGSGKSSALHLLADRLSNLRDVTVGILTRPQSKLPDFYREMGEVFGVNLSPSNRWGGFKALREKWKNHVSTTLLRPVLLIDEAQEMNSAALSELRLLQSADFDTSSYLTVVLCGDERLVKRFSEPDLLPIQSRIRVRLELDRAEREEMLVALENALERAGNRQLLSREVMETMVEHCAGNFRTLMIMGGELLQEAMARELAKIDEKLYLEVFAAPPSRNKKEPLKVKVR
jgi:type II secretory pathway predicted ATPase ExeA